MSGVRISGGSLRGRRLTVPRGARPTGARQREALFSIWGPRLPGARVADLFAGSGAIGMEALSRGAERALFVEWRPVALRQLRRNLEQLGLDGRAEVRRAELPAGLERAAEGWWGTVDLAYADPPYRFRYAAELLRGVGALLAPGGELGLELPSRVEPPAAAGRLVLRGRRAWGGSAVAFYGLGEDPPPG